jgi:hypothetical protein
MKRNNVYYITLTAFLIPLWIVLFTPLVEKYLWLHITVIIFISLIILAILIYFIHEQIIIHDLCYKLCCRRIDAIVEKARKKLQRVITRTNNMSVIEYALDMLQEVTPLDIYIGILYEMAEKEKREAIKNIIYIRAKHSGGNV